MELGVCYFPEHWSEKQWPKDIKKMKEIGISTVRIFEFTWAFVEKKEGIYSFSLLNEIVSLLEKHNIKIIMCTPTASPPPWLLKKYPETRKNIQPNEVVRNNTRKAYSYASKKYQELCKKICVQYAKNFQKYKNIIGWQLDNEYGPFEYSQDNLLGFHQWLKHKYKTIDNLNQAWGSNFWALIYNEFEEIEFPAHHGCNPSLNLDFHRYHSDVIASFNKIQVDIIKKYYPDVPITHNFRGSFIYFNQFDLMKDLDIPGLNFYPLASLSRDDWPDDRFDCDLSPTQITKKANELIRRSDHLLQGFKFDLTRGGEGKFWILETQPGAINWCPYNAIPEDGMIRLWGLEAIAHGAELLTPFRWRQCLYGHEMFHSGLLLPNGEIGQGGKEYKQLHQDIDKLKNEHFIQKTQNKIAFIYSFEGSWAYMVQPYSKYINRLTVLNKFYKAFTDLALSVDMISPEHDFSNYELLILTHNMIADHKLSKKLENFKGKIIIGPRVFSRDQNLHIPIDLPPTGLEKLIDVKVEQIEGFTKEFKEKIIYNNKNYLNTLCREHVRTTNKVVATFDSRFRKDAPAVIENNNVTYFACIPEVKMIRDYIKNNINFNNPHKLNKVVPDNIKIKTVNNFVFVFNYSAEDFDTTKYLPKNHKIILGDSLIVKSADVLVIKNLEPTNVG